MMGCEAALACKVPVYVAREIRLKDDGGQPIKESVCNAVGGLLYKTDKPTLNKTVTSMIHETVRTGIALQLLGQKETKELSEDMQKAAKDKACQFKAFDSWHSLLWTSGAGRRFKLCTIHEARAAATLRIREALQGQVINKRRAASLYDNVINESKLLNDAARGVFKPLCYKCMDQWLLAYTRLAWRTRLSRERAARAWRSLILWQGQRYCVAFI